MADEGAKKQRRDIEKKMTVHVQQICGTQQQVRAHRRLLVCAPVRPNHVADVHFLAIVYGTAVMDLGGSAATAARPTFATAGGAVVYSSSQGG